MVHPTVAKFIAENGDFVTDDSGNWHIFETGAMHEFVYEYGAMIPPFKEGDRCADERNIAKTLRNKLYYFQRKLGAAIRAFEVMKKELESRANSAFANASYAPSEDEIQKLYDAQTEVKKFRDMAEAIDFLINPPRPVVAPTPVDIAAQEKAQTALEKIRNIEV